MLALEDELVEGLPFGLKVFIVVTAVIVLAAAAVMHLSSMGIGRHGH